MLPTITGGAPPRERLRAMSIKRATGPMTGPASASRADDLSRIVTTRRTEIAERGSSAVSAASDRRFDRRLGD